MTKHISGGLIHQTMPLLTHLPNALVIGEPIGVVARRVLIAAAAEGAATEIDFPLSSQR